MAATSRRRARRYGEHVWQPLVENDFSLGMFRDRQRHMIPPGGAYDVLDMLVHKPGSAFKRGGTNYASVATDGGTALVSIIEYGSDFVVMSNETDAHLYRVDASSSVDLGATGFATPWTICKPFSWQGVLVFPNWQGGTSADVPFYYDGTTADTFNAGAAYGRVICVHLDRIVLANTQANQNRLWFSPTVDAHLDPWDLDNAWIDVEGAIAGMASVSGQLLVWTDTRMYRITGQSPPPVTDMFVEQMSDVGCHDARSITVHRGQAYFVNEDGAYVTTGIAPVNLMEDRIQTYWRQIMQIGGDNPYSALANEDQLTTGVFGDRFLFVSLLKNSSSEEFYFLCDLTNRAWVRLSNLKGYMFTDDGRYMATDTSNRVVGTRGIFAPSADNMADADGTDVTFTLETRAAGAATGLTAYGDARITYDMVAPATTFAMKADASVADAFAEVDLGSDLDDYWVTARIRFSAAAIAGWEADNASHAFLATYDDSSGVSDQTFLQGDSGDFGWVSYWWDSLDVSPVANTWQLVELHHVLGTVSAVFVDGVLSNDAAPADDYVGRILRAGLIDGVAPGPNFIAYIDYVKVGTNRGLDDVFADDFEDGTLDAWTSTTGDVSVVEVTT